MEFNNGSSDEPDLRRAIGGSGESRMLGALTGAVTEIDAAGEGATEVSDAAMTLGDAVDTERGVRMEEEEEVVAGVGEEKLHAGRDAVEEHTHIVIVYTRGQQCYRHG